MTPTLKSISDRLVTDAVAFIDLLKLGLDERDEDPALVFDLSAAGIPRPVPIDELTRLAASAKSKVKANPRGWSLVTQEEIVALAWFADLFLENVDADPFGDAKPAPVVISDI